MKVFHTLPLQALARPSRVRSLVLVYIVSNMERDGPVNRSAFAYLHRQGRFGPWCHSISITSLVTGIGTSAIPDFQQYVCKRRLSESFPILGLTPTVTVGYMHPCMLWTHMPDLVGLGLIVHSRVPRGRGSQSPTANKERTDRRMLPELWIGR